MPAGLVFAAAALSSLLDGGSDGPTRTVMQAGFLVVALAAIILSARNGVWLRPREIVVRSWFTTRRYPITPTLVCSWDRYSGLIGGGWEDRWHLNLVMLDGSSMWSVRGLLAFRRSALRQTRLINNHIAIVEPRGRAAEAVRSRSDD